MIELLPIMPTTWSVVTSCLASAAICDGLVCSVTGKNLIGCPLIPPWALPHARYAPAVVSMPQEGVETLAADDELDAPGDEAAAVLEAGALEEAAGGEADDELELQPARTPSASAATTAAAVRVRPERGLFMCSAFS